MSDRTVQLKAKIIINADDYGMTPGVNRAVEQLHKMEKLTSVSLIVNMPWSADAFAFAGQEKGMRLGVHLNLTTGRPVSPLEEVPSLVTREGQFYDMSAFIPLYVARLIRPDEIEHELSAQIALARQHGIRPQHLDSHMHFHALKSLGRMVDELADRHHVPTVRNPRLSAFTVPTQGRLQEARMALRRAGRKVLSSTRFALTGRSNALGAPERTTERLIYLRWYLERSADPYDAFRASLEGLDGRSMEIIAHPAYLDDVLPTLSNYVSGRKREFEFLKSDAFSPLIQSGPEEKR
jgi:predicted glycoside hydrolase/deacetylase ChbG (UPF0249 family)